MVTFQHVLTSPRKLRIPGQSGLPNEMIFSSKQEPQVEGDGKGVGRSVRGKTWKEGEKNHIEHLEQKRIMENLGSGLFFLVIFGK